jgi:NDP-sugar pyrophosphorylase family protein
MKINFLRSKIIKQGKKMEEAIEYFLSADFIVHAGGLSERWWPVTQGKIPKPMTEIGKKPRPILDWVILPYVAFGVKHFFITLWHNPNPIIEHCEEISKNTGIKFTYLLEPENKRLGRAGVLKFYIEKGILSKDKPKIIFNASDIIRIDLKKLAYFHFSGIRQGFFATIVGSPSEISQFGRIKCDPLKGCVVSFEEKPLVYLPKGEYVNTGMYLIDSNLNHLFFEINEDELPIDLERSKIIYKMCNHMRCFEEILPLRDWIWCKTIQDYKLVKDMDFESFFGISPVEKYLGPYKSKY